MTNQRTSPESIRIPAELKKEIQKLAKKENRTFSNMVVTILQNYLTNKTK